LQYSFGSAHGTVAEQKLLFRQMLTPIVRKHWRHTAEVQTQPPEVPSTHPSPDTGQVPTQRCEAVSKLHVSGRVVVVVLVVLVVVVADAQPVSVHASQQLGTLPTQAVPPGGGWHAEARGFVRHFVAPSALVRQQVTKPGLPQVERAAQRVTRDLQLFGRSLARARCFATPVAQLT
jgi:hypothetical protein